ncbi:hypothetical protein MSG28_005996 [Choristoneura fumiferana]|uniref:Uncharacterized protein n=1 Tax=Choristoneura fumiferana TaxID=7141 RepID=A0ACC0L150_CHOFU|nr:hypothetical protein MSG28_005996 [Choristoneura fumiferana]
MCDEAPPSKKSKPNEEPEPNFADDLDPEAESFQVSDQFHNFVRPEELEKLREFTVLDEVKSNDEDSGDEDTDDDDGKSEGIPEDEIEKMLEEDLPEDFKVAPKPKEKPYITRQKTVLEEKGVNQFEVLPLDWMLVRHYSGMPVYMHRGTRVCTLAKPYSLGKGNTRVRRHDIPISAIPCLAYRRALEEEEKQKVMDERIKEQIENGTWSNSSENAGENIPPLANSSQNNGNNSQVNVKVANNSQEDTSESGQETKFSEGNNEKTKELGNEINMQDEIREVKSRCPFRAKERLDKADKDETAEKDDIDNGNAKCLSNGCAEENNVSENNKNIGEVPVIDVIEYNKNIGEVLVNDVSETIILRYSDASPRVETVNTSWKTQQLTHDQVNDYCKRLFKFKTVNIMHFKRWADRRKYAKARKTLQYPTLPEGTKLITIPAQPASGPDNGGKASKRDWVMNMNGRSYLSVFHEYVRRALQKQPVYEFKQLGELFE